jgi:hypothetical protein
LDRDTIIVCLFNKSKDLLALARRKRLPLLKAGKTGVSLLQYILGKPEIWLRLVDMEPKTLLWLCDLVIGEGHAHVLLQWVAMTADASEIQRYTNKASNYIWRGALLRLIVCAHLLHDTIRSADQAIQALLKIAEWKDRVMRQYIDAARRNNRDEVDPTLYYTSTWPALVELEGGLTSGEFERTAPILFDRFVEYYSLINKRDVPSHSRFGVTRYGLARLQLWHPRAPDTKPALEYLEDQVGDHRIMEERRALLSQGNLSRESFLRFMERTSTILRYQRNTKDAQRVDALSRELFQGTGLASS